MGLCPRHCRERKSGTMQNFGHHCKLHPFLIDRFIYMALQNSCIFSNPCNFVLELHWLVETHQRLGASFKHFLEQHTSSGRGAELGLSVGLPKSIEGWNFDASEKLQCYMKPNMFKLSVAVGTFLEGSFWHVHIEMKWTMSFDPSLASVCISSPHWSCLYIYIGHRRSLWCSCVRVQSFLVCSCDGKQTTMMG